VRSGSGSTRNLSPRRIRFFTCAGVSFMTLPHENLRTEHAVAASHTYSVLARTRMSQSVVFD
jgi:hypothetical protein